MNIVKEGKLLGFSEGDIKTYLEIIGKKEEELTEEEKLNIVERMKDGTVGNVLNVAFMMINEEEWI